MLLGKCQNFVLYSKGRLSTVTSCLLVCSSSSLPVVQTGLVSTEPLKVIVYHKAVAAHHSTAILCLSLLKELAEKSGKIAVCVCVCVCVRVRRRDVGLSGNTIKGTHHFSPSSYPPSFFSSSCLSSSHLDGTGGGLSTGWRVLCTGQVLPQRQQHVD